jgi:hypothetical protein
LLVPEEFTNFNRFNKEIGLKPLQNAMKISTSQMRNVYSSIDHNSFYYSKYFIDMIAPVLIKLAIHHNESSADRFKIYSQLTSEFNSYTKSSFINIS